MLAEAKARLGLPTPAFWKKVQRRATGTAVAFTGLTMTLATISNSVPSFPAFLATAAGVCAAFFGGIAAICSLAVDDPTALPSPEPPPPASPNPILQ